MNDIEKKALALVNEVETERGMSEWTDVCRSELTMGEALCRAIEQHEAFRQEVSDEIVRLGCWPDTINLQRFIIAKPDPLVEAVKDCQFASLDAIEDYVAKKLREALAKRGGQIVWGDE